MIRSIRFQFKRLNRWTHLLIFLFLLVCAFYFVMSGVREYRSFLKEKKDFINIEKIKVNQYENYLIYGAQGHRILFQHSPLNIFFDSGSFLSPPEATVDASEIIKINTSRKGKSMFRDEGYFKGAFDFIAIFGSLFMLYLGAGDLRSIKHVKIFRYNRQIAAGRLIRLILLAGGFLSLYGLIFLAVRLSGVRFPAAETVRYILVCGYSLLFLWFFYLLGLLTNLIFMKRRKMTAAVALVSWIMLVIFVPSVSGKFLLNRAGKLQSEANINIVKFSRQLDYDRGVLDTVVKARQAGRPDMTAILEQFIAGFFTGVFDPNLKLEMDQVEDIKSILSSRDRGAVWLPTAYYAYLLSETSSQGYRRVIDFYDYIMNFRQRFMKYYFRHRYLSGERRIVPFNRGDENIFRARSGLPANFLSGTLLTGLYCLVLFGASLLLSKRRRVCREETEGRIDFDIDDMKPGKTGFVLCRDAGFRDRLCQQIAGESGGICLDRVEARDIDPGLAAGDIVPYLRHLRGISSSDRVDLLLKLLESETLLLNSYRRRGVLGDEELRKIYLAVRLGEDHDTVVFNDYIQGMSKAGERQFKQLLARLKKEGKKIYYLSIEMYDMVGNRDREFLGGRDFRSLIVDFDKITVR